MADVITTNNLLSTLYGAFGGAVITLVALRTRLAMMQRDIDDTKAEAKKFREGLDTRLSLMSRQQVLCLQIMSDVAHKVGADNRFSDQIVKFLAATGAEE